MRGRRLRFAAPPDTDVRFSGSPGTRSLSQSRRDNLPKPVEAGVDYEDVRVVYRLRNRLTGEQAPPPPHDLPAAGHAPRSHSRDPDADTDPDTNTNTDTDTDTDTDE